MDNVPTEVEQKVPFYNEYGQVTNPEVAERMAYSEAETRNIEEVAKKDYETERTEQERYNEGVMEILKEHYPHAFVSGVTEDGMEYIRTGTLFIDPGRVHGRGFSRQRNIPPERDRLAKEIFEQQRELKSHFIGERHYKELLSSIYLSHDPYYRPASSLIFSRKGITTQEVKFVGEGSDYNDMGELIDDENITNPSSLKNFSEKELEQFKKQMSLIEQHNKLLSEEYGVPISEDFWVKAGVIEDKTQSNTLDDLKNIL